MRWRLGELPPAVVAVILVWLSCHVTALPDERSRPRAARRHRLRQLTRQAFQHAYEGYKAHAFPQDELLPLSCRGQGHDRANSDNTAVNDVMGDFSLTLVDTIDTFAVMGDHVGFENAVREAIEHVSFDVDSRVQVFEVTIRQLGGLLSAHQLATSTKRGFLLPWYKGELLQLAHDLARRLLPAFDTPTGLPYARVHLQHGLLANENAETCSAGAGSLVLEFVTLSRLTGDPIFETVAKRAFFAVWNNRSEKDLVGNTISVTDGRWLHAVSSTGAGIDSIFEYAAKAYILLGEDEWLRVWDDAYSAILKYIKTPDGFWYRGANMETGALASVTVDSLSAFFPGVQVLMGDVEAAIKSHAVYAWQWRRFHALPELFDINRRNAVVLGYPLRPEFIESNMYLYHATKDDFYLDIAEQVLYDLTNRTTTSCGMAALLDVNTGELEDKMPSFLTSETLKYLYMTFAEPDDQWTSDDSNMVFTTEGHMIELPYARQHHPRPHLHKKRKRRKAAPVCPVYDPLSIEQTMGDLMPSVATRTDMDLARFLTGYAIVDERAEVESGRWIESGWCDRPAGEQQAYSDIDILFAVNANQEDKRPAKSKVARLDDGTIRIAKIAGLRFSLSRVYDVTDAYVVNRVGSIKVDPNAYVRIEDPAVLNSIKPRRPTHATLKFTTHAGQDDKNASKTHADDFVASSNVASFGPPFVAADTPDGQLFVSPPPFGTGCEPPALAQPTSTNNNSSSSRRANEPDRLHNTALVVRRGDCTFAEKASHAKAHGYSAVIVVNGRSQDAITPSATDGDVPDQQQEQQLTTVEDSYAPLFLVDFATGERLEAEASAGRHPKVEWIDSHQAAITLGGYLVLNVRI